MNESFYDKATLYNINENYIKELKKIDPKVQNNYNGQRLYYKVDRNVQNNDNINYYIPLSSAKANQKSIDNKSLFKIYGDKQKEDYLGALHINNMIPVPKNEVNTWNPRNSIDEKYSILVVKQAKYLNKHRQEIDNNFDVLYSSKLGTIDKEYFKKNRGEVMTYRKITSDIEKLEKFSISKIQQRELISKYSYEIE